MPVRLWLVRSTAAFAIFVVVALVAIGVSVHESVPWLKQLFQALGHIAAIASVVALLFAFQQGREARLVRESLSTRFVGQFPDYLPEITRVVGLAQTEIVIVCDFPSYGRFSKSDAWLDYSHMIEKKIEAGLRVALVCMTPEARIAFSRKQFFHTPPSTEEWSSKRDSAKFQGKFAALLKRHGRELDAKSIDYDSFISLLEREDVLALEKTFTNGDVTTTASPMPLYFWISDRKLGFVAFPTYTVDKSELGFLTSDHKLIESFLQVYESYRATA